MLLGAIGSDRIELLFLILVVLDMTVKPRLLGARLPNARYAVLSPRASRAARTLRSSTASR
jgi:hypothetical protein